MIERYYDQEGPFLVADLPRIRRRCMIVSAEEQAAFDVVLDEFFHLDGDAWHHDRCDRVLAEYRETECNADVKREHEADRKARHRARRAELFEALRTVGVVPDFNTDIKTLEAMVRQRVPQLSQGTGRGQDAEGTTKPLTNNHKPCISPPTPPAGRGGDEKKPRPVGKFLPDGFGLDDASPDGVAEDVKAVARKLRDELSVDWVGGTLRFHLDAFRSHYRAKSGRAGRSADWLASWESWCREAMRRNPAADPVRRDVQAAAGRSKARDSPPAASAGASDGDELGSFDSAASVQEAARRRGVVAYPGESFRAFRVRVEAAPERVQPMVLPAGVNNLSTETETVQ